MVGFSIKPVGPVVPSGRQVPFFAVDPGLFLAVDPGSPSVEPRRLRILLHGPEILRPVDVPSPGIYENDGSSSYYSDSSSHYGSPILPPPELATSPLNFPVASLLATMDYGPVMQGGLVSARVIPPSDRAAVNGLNDPGPSDQAPAPWLGCSRPPRSLLRVGGETSSLLIAAHHHAHNCNILLIFLLPRPLI
ncbi:hypothetical protein OIU76_023298 [Salix suchowensis]|nr:hypothetical protein OIU76_023298 [Salix suchowensis]